MRVLALALFPTLLLLPGTSAQDPPPAPDEPEVYKIYLEPIDSGALLEVGDSYDIRYRLHDLSRDATNRLAPDANQLGLRYHFIQFEVIIHTENSIGWSVPQPPPVSTRGGEVVEGVIPTSVNYQVQSRQLDFTLRASYRSPEGPRTSEINITLLTNGLNSFLVQPGIPQTIGPDQPGQITLRIKNNGLIERQFDVTVTSDPCGLSPTDVQGIVVGPKETREYTLHFSGPRERPWYINHDCSLGVAVSRSDRPAQALGAFLMVKVDGPYVDPAWVMWTIGVMAAIILIAFLVKRQKERVEEELLGKPEKPWNIPVERVYLRHLKARDERAWYVVRHFLMEDEYRSALAWYHNYKRATKGERKKERTILSQEHGFEKWEAAWQKRLARPAAKMERFEAKLQKKLERQAHRGHRNDLRKWRKTVRKIEKAHAAQEERALEKWQKQAAKAEKKGREAPPRPDLGGPDLPDQPVRAEVGSAHEVRPRKVERHRSRMERKRERLEAKHARQHERMLRKVRRKVRRVARKLDDPDFAAEHPLLREDSTT